MSGMDRLSDEGLTAFAAYFRKNYPGPDTIICNPDWHAPRLYRAALDAHRRASQPAPAPSSDGLKFKPLEWLETWGGSDDDIPSWDAPNPFWRTVGFCFAGRLYDGKRIDRHKDAPIDWVNEAKAKAQENYEGRVRKCLSAALAPAPAPSDGLREENERLRGVLAVLKSKWLVGDIESKDFNHV